jgi:glycolate oxidase
MARALPSDAVLTSPDDCAPYARDASEAEGVVPAAVVRAREPGHVAAVLAACHAHGVPVTPRAGGTSRVGGAVPVHGGVVLTVEGMNGVDELDRDELLCVVQPGLVTSALHAAAEAVGLFYPPDPSSLDSCCIGGNVAANAGGPRAFKYGVTRDYVLGLEVVLADGTPLSLGRRTRKGVTGYDLTGLVVGSEGTLAVVTRATLRLLPLPERVATLLVLLPDVHAAARAVSRLVARRLVPRCLELLDATTLDLVRARTALGLDARARAMLLIELDGPDGVAVERDVELAGAALDDAGAIDVLVAKHEADRAALWSARRDLSWALRSLSRWKLSEDVVVPRTRVPALLDEVARISERERVRMPAYGHAGDGNLHVNLLWDDNNERPAVDRAIEALFRTTVALGGTLSGEHGIGVLKAPYLPLEQGPALIAAQRALKASLDPRAILNPGKVFPALGHPGGCLRARDRAPRCPARHRPPGHQKPSDEHRHRPLHGVPQRLQPARAHGPVDDAMVTAQRHLEPLAGHDLAIPHHGLVAHRADSEDGTFGRVDHGSELFDVEHAEVRYRKRPVTHLLGT